MTDLNRQENLILSINHTLTLNRSDGIIIVVVAV